MNLIGRVLLGERQGRELAEGAKLFVPEHQLRLHVYGDIKPGDVIWVQEPYYHCLPKNRWSCQTINEIVPGPRFGMKFPAWLQRLPHRATYYDGTRMPRRSSRATLIVEALGDTNPGAWCIVRMMQVDVLLQSGAAA